jgi:hypothetical protein
MRIVIFNKDNSFHMAVSSLPNQGYLDDTLWTVAKIPEEEEFDGAYSYLPIDGVAVKGALIVVDTVERDRVTAEVAAIKYKEDRKYPPIGDQLDALFHAGAFPTDMAAQIQAAKDSHPKPTEEA